mgnify:CR=1 FL=1
MAAMKKVKNYGAELFSSIDFSCLDFLNTFNIDDKHNLVNYLYHHYYNCLLITYDEDEFKSRVENRIWSEADELNEIYRTTVFVYDPLNNYNLTESIKRKTEGTKQSDDENTRTNTDKIEDNGTGSVTTETTGESIQKQFPMSQNQSVGSKPVSQDNTSGNGLSSSTNNNTRTQNQTIKDTGSQSENNTEDETVDATKKGFINITPQELVKAQRDIIICMFPYITKLFDDFFMIDWEE